MVPYKIPFDHKNLGQGRSLKNTLAFPMKWLRVKWLAPGRANWIPFGDEIRQQKMKAGLSKNLIRHLPYLRRYARALTGSQEAGDEYVRLSLELILQESGRTDGESALRLQLFKAFHDVWRTMRDHGSEIEPTPFTEERLIHRLADLPPLARQALLLVAVEEFSYEHTAEILQIDIESVRDLLAKAREEIAAERPQPILIIEDEPAIALEISTIVEDAGHQVCGIAPTKDQALRLARKNPPALILADIQLRDGDDGIDTVKALLKSIEVPVIFVTGYPERLLTGNGLEPAFVIAKPFDPEMLKLAIGHALTLDSACIE